jgi:DNA processing protein
MHNHELNRSLIALTRIRGLGRTKITKILQNIPDVRHSNYLEFIEKGIELNLLAKTTPISDFLDARNSANDILEICRKNGIHIRNAYSSRFPDVLKGEDGPILIYYKGDISLLSSRKRAAVIGTRVPSQNGREFARWAGEQLAKNGYVVNSGLAQGCDTAAHLGCMDKKGKTVAFLPSSILNITPRENTELAQRIVNEGGCLISEYSSYDIANAGMFVERDRLQAMSSQFIIVSEFEKNSGTLHTLQFADQWGKPIISLSDLADSGITGFQALESEKIPYSLKSRAAIEDFLDKN